MTQRNPLLASLPALALLVAACGGSDAETTPGPIDSGTPDTYVAPDAAPETTAEDASADTSVPASDAADAAAADADAPADWPSCDGKPAGATAATVPELWTANPTTPRSSWVSGVVVTAVSTGGCATHKACQIFVQEESTETTLAGVARKAIKVFVSAKAAARFTGIVPGDKVDLAGHAFRYTLAGQNELLLQVNDLTRGCIKKTGTGTITPVPATLPELGSVAAYETTFGPVLVQLKDVSGNTDSALTNTFGMFPTTGGFEAGAYEVVSLSPYCLPASTFTGITTKTRYNFATVTGVFGMFAPPPAADGGVASKYLQVYPRSMADLAIK